MKSVSNPPQRIRISERQALRKQRKGEQNPAGVNAKWVIGGTRGDERRLLETMIDFLHGDTTQDGNPRIALFLLRQWGGLSTTIHTVATMELVKERLLDMGVPYIRKVLQEDGSTLRGDPMTRWEYWNNYTLEGMQIFRTTAHPDRRNLTVALNMTETIRESESLETPDGSDSITSLLESKEEDTPVVSGLAQNKGSVHAQNKGHLALEFDKRERRKTEKDTHSAEIVDNPELAMDSQQSGPLLDLTDKGVVLDTQVDPRQASDGNPGILADINADRSPMVDMQDITQKNARRRLETRTVAEMTNQLANQDTRPLADPTQMLRQFESIMMNRTQDANKQFDVRQRA